jgi:choline-glycine betaine transporter
VIGGVLAFYLVTTGLLTVRRGAHPAFRRIDVAAMLVAFAASAAAFGLAFQAATSPNDRLEGLPPGPAIMFGVVGLIAAVLDARMLARGIEGAHRIARHLWRMCYGLWIATMSFFLGQPDVFPEPLRQLPAVRAIPVVLLLVTMIYWLVRVLRRRGPGGGLIVRADDYALKESPLKPIARPDSGRTPARGTI